MCDAIKFHLQAIKRAATLEIRYYPLPIAGYDAQIPVLWEKRDGIAAELDWLSKSREKATIDAGNAINAFIATSHFIDDDKNANSAFAPAKDAGNGGIVFPSSITRTAVIPDLIRVSENGDKPGSLALRPVTTRKGCSVHIDRPPC